MIANLTLLFSGFLGYIVSFIAISNARYNKVLNIFLLFIIIFSSSLLLLAGFGELYNSIYLKGIYFKLDNYTALFIPAFYLYFKNLISNRGRFIFKNLLHILFLFLVILENNLSIIGRLFAFEYKNLIYHFFVFYSTTYIVIIFHMLYKNVWNKSGTLKYIVAQNILIKKWTIILFILVIACMIRVYVGYIFYFVYSNPMDSDHSTKNLWVTGLVWIILFLIILSNPKILYGFNSLKEETTNNNNNSNFNNYWNKKSSITINNNQDKQLKEKINSKIENYLFQLNILLHNNDYFINSNFSIKELAQVLNIPISHLKYVFKYHSIISFSDFKKISRIQNSLRLINNDYLNTNTLESLAKEVGFKSYNPFFTCFKDIVGKSPHEYITTLKVDLN
jgi:AraC-like DNA-binding protein